MEYKLVLYASCVCLAMALSANDAASVNSLLHYSSNNGVLSGTIDSIREKRAIGLVGSAIARGLKAVEVLLRRSRPVEADKRFYKYSKYGDEYEKTGTYEAAMNDFNSVYPEGVHHYVLPKGNILTVGQVGDRTLFVKKFGAFGQPTLEILQNIGRPHEIRSDLIIYTGIKQMP